MSVKTKCPVEGYARKLFEVQLAIDAAEKKELDLKKQGQYADERPKEELYDHLETLERLITQGRTSSAAGAMAQLAMISHGVDHLLDLVPEDRSAVRHSQALVRGIERCLYSILDYLESEGTARAGELGVDFYMLHKNDYGEKVSLSA